MSHVVITEREADPESVVGSHIYTIYRLLDESAQDEIRGEDKLRVFRGSFRKVYTSTGVSNSHYTLVRKCLEDLGAITELTKGSRNVDSVIILHGLPNGEAVDEYLDDHKTPAEQKRVELERRVATLEKRLQGVDMIKALAHLQEEINNIKKHLQGE